MMVIPLEVIYTALVPLVELVFVALDKFSFVDVAE